MRFRLLVSLPFSLLIVGLFFVSASSLMAAVEGPPRLGSGPIRAFDAPLLCPVALDPRIDREYTRLRGALHAHCGTPRGILDFGWEVGVRADVAERCELAHDGREAAARGESAPSSYFF